MKLSLFLGCGWWDAAGYAVISCVRLQSVVDAVMETNKGETSDLKYCPEFCFQKPGVCGGD